VGEGEIGNCKRLSRCESKGEGDGCHIVALGFGWLNPNGCKLAVGGVWSAETQWEKETPVVGFGWLKVSRSEIYKRNRRFTFVNQLYTSLRSGLMSRRKYKKFFFSQCTDFALPDSE
jgi:hypothetical protein